VKFYSKNNDPNIFIINIFMIVKLNKFPCLVLFTLLFLNFQHRANADLIRNTTFDDRPSCEQTGGTWRDFGNICADKCQPKFEKYPVCTYGISFSCDCGKNRCLHEDKCILIDEYQKIYEAKVKEESKINQKLRKKRARVTKKFQDDHLNKLSGIFNADPNYRDPNRYDRERELPINTFRSTNRMLIYNDIINKRNARIQLIQKKYQDQIAMLDSNNPEDMAKKAELEKKLARYKAIKPVNDNGSDMVRNYNNQNDDLEDLSSDQYASSKDNSGKNSLSPAKPIVLQPIVDVNDNASKPNNQSAEDTANKIFSPQELLKKAQNIMNSGSAPNSNPQSAEKTPSQKNPFGQNISSSSPNIPPVYVKQQNGDEDFKNGDIVNNSGNVPQFSN